MQLAGPGVWGPPRDIDGAIAVLREAVAAGVQVALAWLLHRSQNMRLIPGTSSVGHLRENLAAAQLTLSPQVLSELDGIASAAASAKH